MSLTISTEHVETALSRLLHQFKDKPNIEAFISALIQQLQLVEDTVSDMLYLRQVATAVGENLNVLGRIVGQPREGRSDDDYRIWIKARIQINKSSGLAEEIYNVIKLVTGFTAVGDIEIEEPSYPAYFSLTVLQPLGDIDPQVLYDVIDQMRSACVAFNLTYSLFAPIAQYDVVGAGYNQGYYGQTI